MEFLKNNKRFSFKLGGKNAWETEYESKTYENDNELVTEYFFRRLEDNKCSEKI